MVGLHPSALFVIKRKFVSCRMPLVVSSPSIDMFAFITLPRKDPNLETCSTRVRLTPLLLPPPPCHSVPEKNSCRES